MAFRAHDRAQVYMQSEEPNPAGYKERGAPPAADARSCQVDPPGGAGTRLARPPAGQTRPCLCSAQRHPLRHRSPRRLPRLSSCPARSSRTWRRTTNRLCLLLPRHQGRRHPGRPHLAAAPPQVAHPRHPAAYSANTRELLPLPFRVPTQLQCVTAGTASSTVQHMHQHA